MRDKPSVDMVGLGGYQILADMTDQLPDLKVA
jgi:hypothetical protein